MHTFQTPIPHKIWLGKLVFFLLFFTFWSLIRLIWRQMCWISIVGVSSNIIILESSNYKILSIFYYVYQTMWNTDNLNQQNFTSNCTLILNEKKKIQKEIPSETYIDLVSLPLQTWNCRPLAGKKLSMPTRRVHRWQLWKTPKVTVS